MQSIVAALKGLGGLSIPLGIYYAVKLISSSDPSWPELSKLDDELDLEPSTARELWFFPLPTPAKCGVLNYTRIRNPWPEPSHAITAKDKALHRGTLLTYERYK